MASVPTTKPPKGFMPWCHQPPPYELGKVRIWREGMFEPETINRHGQSPMWNIAGVYWAEPVSQNESDVLLREALARKPRK